MENQTAPPQPTQSAQQIDPAQDPWIHIQPPVCKFTLKDRVFTLLSMPESQCQEWLGLWLERKWRQHIIFRNTTAVIAHAQVSFEDEKANKWRAEKIAEITKEWVTLNHAMLAKALRLPDSELGFIRELSPPEQVSVIEIQSKLNGLDVFAALAAVENQLREKGQDINPPSPEFLKRGELPSKLLKEIAKAHQRKEDQKQKNKKKKSKR